MASSVNNPTNAAPIKGQPLPFIRSASGKATVKAEPVEPAESIEDKRVILLTRGEATIVDGIDYKYLSQWSWFFNGKYAGRTFRPHIEGLHKKTLLMHIEIMKRKLGEKYDPKKKTDHKDLNGLNNTRLNLRVASHAQNTQNHKIRKDNTTGYTGISICKSRHRKGPNGYCGYWKIQLSTDFGRIIHCRENLDEALLLRDRLARKHHGEFAVLNIKRFPRLRFPRLLEDSHEL